MDQFTGEKSVRAEGCVPFLIHVSVPPSDYAADESCAPRGYLAATMQFVPGHFSCDVVWGTVIRVHSRLKMGPSMGVSRGT